MEFYRNKTAFITGGSSGIGLAIAKALANNGCHIALFARTVSKLEAAAKEVHAVSMYAEKKHIHTYSVDTSDNKDIDLIFDQAMQDMGVPDILINCVGVAQPDYFENITFDIFDKTIKTNLYSTWNSVYKMTPYMKQKGGIIVNTSSIAGFLGVFGYADYCMTKFGIIGFSEALRSELKQHGLKVQVLCPPDTDTPGFEAENKNKPKETKAIGGKAKLLQPSFIAEALLKDMQTNTFLIIPGLDGKLTRIIKRFFPWIIDWIMNSSIKKAQSGNA